jgi:hypothetical protein
LNILSVDIETTSLNRIEGVILELGLIFAEVDTVNKSIIIRDKLRVVFIDEFKGHCSPFALTMNADLLKEIATYKTKEFNSSLYPAYTNYIKRDTEKLRSIILKLVRGKKWTLAGKNAAGFDIPFIKNSLGIDMYEFSNHGVIDVGSLLLEPNDSKVPDLSKCLKRCKLDDTVTHHAIEDAYNVLQILASKWQYSLSKLD